MTAPASMVTYSSKYNIGYIRNSPINWQNSRPGPRGFVEFANWESGARANTLNAQAKMKGSYTIINEAGKPEQVTVNAGNGFGDLPSLTRINTPPRKPDGSLENDAALRGKFGAPGSDAYNYGQYYVNLKNGMIEYINDPASGYSAEDRQRILSDLNNNRLNMKDARSLEAYNAGLMKAEHSRDEYRDFLDNRRKVRDGVQAALGEKVLDNIPAAPPGQGNQPPDRFKPKPETQKPGSGMTDKDREEWRQKQLKRLNMMAGKENVLNRLDQ